MVGMSHKELRLGLVGRGFMARAHTNAYKRIGDFFPELAYRPVLKAVCARSGDKVKEFANQWGYESVETNWQDLVKRDDIDAIDICSPNDTHAAIAIAAAESGKMVLCEKPLARTVAESQPMVDAVHKAGVKNTVWYNYRRVPAVTLAKQIIDSGKLGKIFHYRANFLQDWTINPELPQGGEALWRLDVDSAKTFEINGENASIRWDLHDQNRLEFFDHGDESVVRGWRSIHVSDSDQPYIDHWWIPGVCIGYEHTFVHHAADFLKSLETGEACSPTFQEAMETQKVCEAVLESAKDRSWKNTAVVWDNA